MTTARQKVRLAVAEQATEWYLRHREGALDDNARQAFQTWLSESPVHVEEYLGVTRLIALLPEAGADPAFETATLVGRARADSLVDFDPGLPAVAAPVRRVRSRHDFFGRLGLVAAAALLVLMGGFTWWNTRVTSFDYATPHGMVKTVVLPDRSVLELNSDSRVTVHYGRNLRQVDLLSGQIYLEVTPDPARPFEVLTGPVQIRDVGTHFDVYRREPLLEVTTVEGAVLVQCPSGSVIARAGQRATVPLAGGALQLQNVEVGAAVAWRSGRLVFRQRPLLEVVDEFNRYSPVRIEIETAGLGSMPVSGVISTQDITSFMAFLNNLPGVKVTAASGHIAVSRED